MIDGLHGETNVQLITAGDTKPSLVCLAAWYKNWNTMHNEPDYKPCKVLDRGIWKDAIPIKYQVGFSEPIYIVTFDDEDDVFGRILCSPAKTFKSLNDDIIFDLRNKAAATTFDIPVNLTMFKISHTKCKIVNIVEYEKPLTAPDALYSVRLVTNEPKSMYTLGNGVMIPCVMEGVN